MSNVTDAAIPQNNKKKCVLLILWELKWKPSVCLSFTIHNNKSMELFGGTPSSLHNITLETLLPVNNLYMSEDNGLQKQCS